MRRRTLRTRVNASAHNRLLEICRRWSEQVGGVAGGPGRIGFFTEALPGLLAERALFREIVAGSVRGNAFPDLRGATMFDNEFVLYQDPGRAYSLRMFIFGPGETTPVHDHSAWGVLGSACGGLEVVRYRRVAAGAGPSRAGLVESDRRVLAPGQTETTRPFDEGIHRTGNPGDGVTLMVNVYGPARRRLYVNWYDTAEGCVRKVYPQRIRKRMLAELALGEL